MISKEAFDEFKAIWKRNFGEDISDAKALESATKLVRLMEIIYRPMTREQFEAGEKRRKELAEQHGER